MAGTGGTGREAGRTAVERHEDSVERYEVILVRIKNNKVSMTYPSAIQHGPYWDSAETQLGRAQRAFDFYRDKPGIMDYGEYRRWIKFIASGGTCPHCQTAEAMICAFCTKEIP